MNKKSKKEEIDYLYDPHIERIVIGSILIESECIYKVGSLIHIDLFFDPAHRIVCEAILSLFKDSVNIDLLTVTNHIKRQNKLSDVGGYGYISGLTANVGSTANIEVHVRLLQQYYLSRLMDQTFNQSKNDLFQNGKDPLQVISEVSQTLEKGLTGVLTREMLSVADIHHENIENALSNLNEKHSGVITGLNRVDNLTNGWQPTDLIILAGRPGMGKTACAITLAMNPAILTKTPVALFSLEMSRHQIVGRMESVLSGINVSRIVKKQLDKNEIDHVDKTSKQLYQAPIYIDDTPNITLNDLKVKSRKLVNDKGVKLILIDYLQLMRSGLNLRSREEEISEISKGLKRIAKELNVTIIALSQLSRSVEQRGGDKKPNLSDLRESGQIEQDADMVVFCYRPEYYNIEEYQLGSTNYDASGLFVFIVAKHRNGELGEIPLTFIHEQTKVANYGETSNSPVFEHSTNMQLHPSMGGFEPITNISLEKDENDEDEVPF